MTLSPTTSANVGIYDVNLVISNPIGYTKPQPGNVPTLKQPFKVTVNPCPITSVIGSADVTVEYKIGLSGVTSAPYSFT